MNIAIDGPSGAGKSTMAKRLASELNILYLDTGAMYRAIGLKTYRSGLDINDKNLENLVKNTEIKIEYENGLQRIFLDGEDVSTQIRQHFISKYASDVSALPFVRLKLVEIQRQIAAFYDSVLDGRDIGTYVLPNADIKFYLTASLEERAKRRYKELKSRGFSYEIDKIREDIEKRDYNDMHRSFAPLKKANDALEIDSNGLNETEVLDIMKKYIEENKK